MKLTHGGDWAGFKNEYGTMPLDFSANISPLGIPEPVKEAIKQSVELSERYPDPLCRELRTALSDYHGVNAENIVCGNGAADIIFRLVQCIKPRTAVVTAPGFAEYEQALKCFDSIVIHHVLSADNDFELTDSILSCLDDSVDMLFICQPNNPTGRLADKTLLMKILEKCRDLNITLVADECFLEFLEDGKNYTLEDELENYENLVILKAFTKIYAIPGIRLGYCLCGSATLAGRLSDCAQPWSVSIPAQAAGAAALKETEYVKAVRELVTSERVRLIKELQNLGLHVIDGKANFLLFYSKDENLCDKLREKGILIRDCSNYVGLCNGWYRTAIRGKAENLRLVKALREVLLDG